MATSINYAEIAKALYRINKQAKAYRDVRRSLSENCITNKDLYTISSLLQDYNYEEKYGRIGVRNQYGSVFTSKQEAYRNMSDDPDYWSDSELEDLDKEEYTEEEIAEMERRSEEVYADYEYVCDGLDALGSLDYDILCAIDEIYDEKNGVLQLLIASGRFAECGIHEFPHGDVRRCYDIEGFLFHGEDIRYTIKDEEYETVTSIDEIPADNILAADMSFAEAMKIIKECHAPIQLALLDDMKEKLNKAA